MTTTTAPHRLALALLLCLLALAGCREPLVEGLSHDDANALAVHLEQQGIAAELEARSASSLRDASGAWTVLVDPHDLPAARAVLLAERERRIAPLDAHDPESEDDAPASALLGPSPREQHRREERQRARALARSLERLDHAVREAHVHLGLGRTDWLTAGRDGEPGHASVLLLLETPLEAVEAERLRADALGLVAGSVPGLAPERVTLVLRVAPPAPTPAELPLAQLGPWRVAPGSLPSMRWVLGALLALLVAQSAVLALLIARRRRRRATTS